MKKDDAQSRMHSLMQQDPVDDAELDTAGNNDNADSRDGSAPWSTVLHAASLSDLSAEAQDIILGLTESSASLEPGTRARFVDAAGRALTKRRDADSPLPRLLFLTRRSNDETVEELAGRISVDATLLRDVERGTVRIESFGAGAVVNWVKALNVEAQDAKDALAKALLLERRKDKAAASATDHDVFREDSFYLEVAALLDSRTSEPTRD